MPSNASVIFCKSSRASHFSIFAITGRRLLHSSIILCTLIISSALRTKDNAIQSAPLSNASLRSKSSCSVMAGTSRVTPGKFTPFPSSISPPTKTSQSIKLAELMLLTLNCILPSLIKIFVSNFKLEKEIPLVTVISPEPSSFEMLKVSPSFMLKPSGTRVTLILGPHRSAIIAGQLPSFNSIDFTKSKSLFLALESP